MIDRNLVARSTVQPAYVGRRLRHFGDITSGNHIVLSIDGQETFKLIYHSIKQAQKSVYLAGYDLDPSLRLIRENFNNPTLNDSKLLTQSHAHSYINPTSSLIVRDTSPPRGSKQNSALRSSYSTLEELVLEKARRGVLVRIIVWQPRLPLRILPGADERGLDGRANEVEELNEIARKYNMDHNIEVRIDNTSPTLSSAHHEKIIVIDNKLGFCGGFDISRGKWDTSEHKYNDPLRDEDSEPWHDVHTMLEGPAVWDLTYHFNQRWTHYEIKNVRKVKGMKLEPPPAPSSSTVGSTRIVALRTWKGMYRGGSILAWYANRIRKAKRSIYVEDQFPFQNEFITRILCQRLREQKNLRVIIVGPMEPNLPGIVGSMLSKTSVNDINKHLQWLRIEGDSGSRVGTYSLVSQDQKTKQLRQIYVHSKLMIVDDKWITIGSANTDKNGFKDSTEVNLGIASTSIAKELRIRLWYEHLGWFGRDRDNEKRTSDYSKIETFDLGFDLWKSIADYNGSSVARNDYIRGHVYYHNFGDMKVPPPYSEAKGGNRFDIL